MRSSKHFKLIGTSIVLAIGLSACDKPGPAETAGKKIDQTASEIGKTLDQTANAVGRKIDQKADEVGRKMGDMSEQMGKNMDAQGAKAEVAIDDTEITAKVKAAIFAEPGLKTLQISVKTVNGRVILSGSVDALEDGERAKALAGAVLGVKSVDNWLVLKIVK